MQVRSGALVPERAGHKLRLSFIAAAIILLLAGAGAHLQQKGLLGEGRQAGVFYQEVKTPDLTGAGLRKAAERIMQEQLGKKLPFVSLERLQEAEQASVIFRTGEDSAAIWISTVTGVVLRMNMNASLLPAETDKDLILAAKKTIQEIGYSGDFKITKVQRFVEYGLSDKLAQVTRQIAGGKDELILNYRQGDYASSFLEY
ncbi:hypothetical protein [Paenibacillus graminis]|uniref:hypothetical protein n=1 Tax=Paenibacillus graminis TaxID=189425 RepID=UPI002DBFD624|nr:hypothetical protein [Paenibacillus graminis]MEC0172837.1 hypothetical protein [Paenibacillus graminis]